MNLEELRKYKPQIVQISTAHGVGNVRVFGSVARGDSTEKSDIDFLVTIEKPMGWHFFNLGDELEALLGCKVDVASEGALHHRLKEKILQEAIPL